MFHEVVAVARNVVQFRAVVIASRWPRGFECPACGGRQYSLVTTRNLYQCAKCRRQTSPIAGTIFASTHLPLQLLFRAIYHLTQTKQGISSIELGRRLGVTQTTAWKIKHKLKQVMLERDATKRLTGRPAVRTTELRDRSGHIVELQSLRGIAATAVLFGHVIGYYAIPDWLVVLGKLSNGRASSSFSC